ncbi:MAG: hypothetical protein AMXMBFR37_07440 [Steroidobacteraceae bacterium]|jgi:hypothetical protein
MKEISVVFSAHRENGLCNARELYKILCEIRPEIAFEEVRPSEFEHYCQHGSKYSLEAKAMALLLQSNSVRRVPVDRFDMPQNEWSRAKQEFDDLFDYVRHVSREYQLLDERNAWSASRYGLPYLNGDSCAAAMVRLAELEDRSVNSAANPKLADALRKWRQLNECRERSMVRQVYEHCKASDFTVGVFLVGVAHKTGIEREIESCSVGETTRIDWKRMPWALATRTRWSRP